MSDQTRKKILERRASFVAAAIASVTVTAACERSPLVCLKVARVDSGAVEDSSADAAVPETGTLDAPDAGSPDTGSPDATLPIPPSVCLKIPPPKDAGLPTPKPVVCLRVPDDQ